jgi:tRNA-modifying protein YgfZ
MTQGSETGRAVLVDLSGRVKFRVTGADRFRFLNGQITNDLRKARDAVAIEACVLNAKGKLNAHMFVTAFGEAFLVDTEPDLREILRERFERYVIADDVEIEDVTDEFSLFHVVTKDAPAVEGNRIVSVHRFGTPGWDIWSNTARHDVLQNELSLESAFVDSAVAEVLRIEQGLPRWGRELTEEIIPIEANLERRTIDYEKGCYIGQEVISRMKISGQTNKRLCGLISLDHKPLQQGMTLADPSASGKKAGWITSATRSRRIGKEIALGYAKRGFNNPGAKLQALSLDSPDAISVEVVSLPFL